MRIVEGGSLTAAAEAMRVSLPSVVRGLAALEQSLDVRLLNRTTRRLALTDEGREYYERCKRVLADVDEAEAALSARRTQPRGRLRVTVVGDVRPAARGAAVGAFIARHPQLSASKLVLLDRVVDLIEEGIDLGVRIGASARLVAGRGARGRDAPRRLGEPGADPPAPACRCAEPRDCALRQLHGTGVDAGLADGRRRAARCGCP